MPIQHAYINAQDAERLFDWLSGETEIAFIERNDAKHSWRAVDECRPAGDRYYTLWHMQSGGIPRWSDDLKRLRDVVAAPSAGWIAPPYTNDPNCPYVGNEPQFFRVRLNVNKSFDSNPGAYPVGVSSVEWIGGHYRTPPPDAKRWWARLCRFWKRGAVNVPGDRNVSDATPWLCWPGAHGQIAPLLRKGEN